MGAHFPAPRVRLTDADIDAEIARTLGTDVTKATHAGLALPAAIAAVEDHARRWVQARRDTLRETGSDAEPARDTRLDLSLAPAAVRSPTGALL